MEGRSFPRLFERRENFLYLQTFLWGIWEKCKKRPCNQATLSIGACWGTWRGFVYWDVWQKKRMHIWAPLSWTQRTLKVKPGGHLELKQGTRIPWADIRVWGTKGSFIRPRWIGTIRARTQMLINQSIIITLEALGFNEELNFFRMSIFVWFIVSG
jgi:hypothetical protein